MNVKISGDSVGIVYPDFTYYPSRKEDVPTFNALRQDATLLLNTIKDLVPDGHSKQLALDSLNQALMLSVRAVNEANRE